MLAINKILMTEMTTTALIDKCILLSQRIAKSVAGFFIVSISRTPYDNKTGNRVRGRKDERLNITNLTGLAY